MATAARNRDRFCLRCGRDDSEVEFRSALAMKCMECDDMTEEERREYHKIYHKARGVAVKELINKYPDEYKSLLVKARRKVERQENKKRSAAA